MASISSMKIMAGADKRARWKASRSAASPSPMYMENSCAPASGCSRIPLLPAAACAILVLLHPAWASALHQIPILILHMAPAGSKGLNPQ